MSQSSGVEIRSENRLGREGVQAREDERPGLNAMRVGQKRLQIDGGGLAEEQSGEYGVGTHGSAEEGGRCDDINVAVNEPRRLQIASIVGQGSDRGRRGRGRGRGRAREEEEEEAEDGR